MRDIIVAGRALLALAAALAVGIAPTWAHAAHPAHPAAKAGRQSSRKHLRVIALDPGHGGADPRAISPRGLYEKNITLATARELARQLDFTRRYRSVLTRRGGRFLPLPPPPPRARAH